VLLLTAAAVQKKQILVLVRNDKSVIVPTTCFRELSHLYHEFGFQDLVAQLSQFRDSNDTKKTPKRHHNPNPNPNEFGSHWYAF
jgi:hypothetical protein